MTRPKSLAALLCLWSMGWLVSMANAQDTKAAEPPLSFRRVFAPADRIGDLPRGNQRLVPIEAEVFEKLIESQRDESTRPDEQTRARLERSVYRATLSADGLLTGDLEWVLSGSSPQARLTLAPCQAGCSSFTWSDGASPPWIGTNSQGQLVVMPRQDGTLKAKWQMRARSQTAEEWTFDFAWPSCVQSTFELDLPASWQVYSGEQVADRSPTTTDMTRWRWQLGPKARLRFSVFPPRGSMIETTYRSTTQFEYANRAWEVTSNWRIDVGRVPLDQLIVEMDAELALSAVYAGEDSLEWLQVDSTNRTKRRYQIQFATPLRGYGRTVRFEAVAAATLGAAHALPRIWASGLVWHEATIRLQVPAPHQLRQLETVHCRQSRSSAVPEPLLAELAEFQCFDETATLRCRIDTPAGEVRYALGSSLLVSDDGTTLNAVAHLRIDQSRRNQLQCTLPADWMLESVDSIPSGRIVDWSIDPPLGNTRSFSLRLNSELHSTQPLRLALRARGPLLSLGTRIGAAALFPLRFSGATFEQGYAALNNETGRFASIVPSPQTPLRKLDSLAAADRELLDEPGGAIVVAFDPRRPLGSVTLVPRRGPLVVRGDLYTKIDATHVHESFRWQCVPQQTAVHRIEVLLQRRRDIPLQWSVPALGDGEWSARRIQAADDEAGQGERWELRFFRPLVDEFELLATRDLPRAGNTVEVNLAVLRDIADQRASISIEGPPDLAVTAVAGPIHEQVVPPPHEWTTPTIRRRFDYAIADDSDAGRLPTLKLRCEPAPFVQPDPVVLRSELHSQFTAARRIEHRWLLECDSTNSPTLTCDLPENLAANVSVWVNDVQHDIEPLGRRLRLPLDVHSRVSRVVMTFSTQERDVWLARSVGPPQCFAGDAVLSHHWTLRLSADYDAYLSGSILRPHGTPIEAAITLPSDARHVLLVHRTRMQMLAWAFGWLAAVLAWRLRWTTFETFSVAALLLLLIAATSPPWQSLGLSTLVGLMLGHVARRWFPVPRPLSFPDSASASRLPAAALSLALILGMPVRVEAQGAADPRGDEARVFIPVDANNQPTGRYLIGEDFLQQLRRSSAAGLPSDDGYALRSARYRGEFTFDELSGTWVLGSLLAELRLIVDRPQEDAPLALGQLDTLVDSVRGAIDGRHTEFIFDQEHKCLRLGSLATGEHLVELELPFLFERRSGTHRATVLLPRVHDAVLDITTSSAAPRLEYSSPTGVIQQTAKSNQLQLGPIDQLQIAWPDQEAAPFDFDVDSLVWLRLRAGAVAADLRVRVEPTQGKYRELDIAVDSRWRLLPWGEVDTPLIDVQTLPLAASTDRVRHYRLTMSQWTDKAVTIPLSFLNTATTGIGTVSSPEVTVTGARQTRRALAATIDPSLSVDLPMAVPNADELAAFIKRWGINEAPPDRVVEPSTASPVKIHVRPQDTAITTTDHTLVDIHTSHIALNYRGSQQAVGSPVFRQLLRVPANWTPRRVRIEQDSVEHAVRWWRLDPNRIELVYELPLVGSYLLLIDGSMPPVIQPQLPLPIVELLGAQRTPESTLELRHHLDLEVTVTDLQDLQPAVASTSGNATSRAWSLSGDRPSAQLEVRPSRVSIEVVQVSRLLHDLRQESLQVDALWMVRDGMLDRVSWIAKSTWPEPRDRQPEMTWQSFAGREPSQQVWLAMLDSPVTESVRTRFRVSLGSNASELIHFPQPLNVQSRVHYVLLPTQLHQQTVRWQTTDLERAELPSELSAANDASYTVYRVTGETPTAYRDQRGLTNTHGVFSAETQLYWQTDRQFVGQTRVVFAVQEEKEIGFALGSDCELLQVAIDGQRADADRAPGDLHWKLDCPHWSLPHELVVTFKYQSAAPWLPWQSTRLPSAWLTNLPIENMTWRVSGTIDALKSWGTVEQPLTEREWALSQAENDVGLLQGVAGQIDMKSPNALAWIGRWSERIAVSLHRAERALERIKSNDPADLNRLQTLRNRLQPWQEQLDQVRSQASEFDLNASGAAILFARTSSKGIPALMIHASSTWMAHALRYAVLASLLALAWHLRHNTQRLDRWIAWIEARRFGSIALVGAAWWLCLEPSWLGMAIMALAAIGRWEQARQRRFDDRLQRTRVVVNR